MLKTNDKIKFIKNGTTYYSENNTIKAGDNFGENSCLVWETIVQQQPEQILIQSAAGAINLKIYETIEQAQNTTAKTQCFVLQNEQNTTLNIVSTTTTQTNNTTQITNQSFISENVQSLQHVDLHLTHTQTINNKTQIKLQQFVNNLYSIGVGIQPTPNQYSIAIKLDNIFYLYYNNQWIQSTEEEFHTIGLDWHKLSHKQTTQLTQELFKYNGEIQIYCSTEYAKKAFKNILIQYGENTTPEILNPQLIIQNYKTPIILAADLKDAEYQQLEYRLLVKRPPLYVFNNPTGNRETNTFLFANGSLYKQDFILKATFDKNVFPRFLLYSSYGNSDTEIEIQTTRTEITIRLGNTPNFALSNNLLYGINSVFYISFIAASKTIAFYVNQQKVLERVWNFKLNADTEKSRIALAQHPTSVGFNTYTLYQNISSVEQVENKIQNNDPTDLIFNYEPAIEQYSNTQTNGQQILSRWASGTTQLLDVFWHELTSWQQCGTKLFAYTTFEDIVEFGLTNKKIEPAVQWKFENQPLSKDVYAFQTYLLFAGAYKQVWNVFADLAEPTQILLFQTAVENFCDRINLYGSNDNIKWDLIGWLKNNKEAGLNQTLEIVNDTAYKKLQLEFIFQYVTILKFAEPKIFTTNKSGEIGLKLEVRDSQDATTEWTTNIHYSNHSPIAAAEISNGRFNARIVDSDLDQTQATLLLNGIERLKLPYNQTPYNIVYTWQDNEVKLNENNTITIVLTDLNGNQTKQNFNFIAKPYGLYFVDEQENFYTTNDGKIKMQLNFDHIVGGHPSKIKPITLINHTQQAIENIRVWSEKWCWFSTGPDGLSETREYTIDSLQAGEKKTIYCFVLPPRTYQGEAIIHIFAEGR